MSVAGRLGLVAQNGSGGGEYWALPNVDLREERTARVPKTPAMLKMLVRTGFVAAMLLGLGALLRLYLDQGFVLWLHMAFGILSLVSAWLLANQPGLRRRLTQTGAAVGTLGALLVVGRFLFWPGVSPWWHIVLMIVAIGCVEVGSARARQG